MTAFLGSQFLLFLIGMGLQFVGYHQHQLAPVIVGMAICVLVVVSIYSLQSEFRQLREELEEELRKLKA